eukprot:COSAG01_NODE_11741_length_1869_cov_1.644068_2_plen_80_part_00
MIVPPTRTVHGREGMILVGICAGGEAGEAAGAVMLEPVDTQPGSYEVRLEQQPAVYHPTCRRGGLLIDCVAAGASCAEV